MPAEHKISEAILQAAKAVVIRKGIPQHGGVPLKYGTRPDGNHVIQVGGPENQAILPPASALALAQAILKELGFVMEKTPTPFELVRP